MAKSSRHLARRCAVQALYQWQMTAQPADEIESSFIKNDKLFDVHLGYFQRVIKSVPKNIDQIDQLIVPHLDREIDKVDFIEQAIMRIAVYEMLFEPDIHASVIIDEAVDIAKIYASEHGYKFVNGVLDKVAREVRADQIS